MKFIWEDKVAATLYCIANTLFMLEKIIKKGETRKTVRIDYYCDISQEKLNEISLMLRDLVLDVLCEAIEFIFTKKEINLKPNKNKTPSFQEFETICLFSGGIDSTLGILKSKKRYNNVIGIYIAHQDLGKTTSKVDKIKKDILDKEQIPLTKFIAPAMGKGYSQLRGFLYILYSAILARYVNGKRIIVSECGGTMYQPKFAPLDTVTYTTHPNVLKISKKISELILDKDIEIITPFEDFTKTEMMSLIADDHILSKTHSCLTARWDKNCGVCYACIARMIGSVNLGLSIDYFKNAVFEKKDNEILSSLINFCLNFELNKGEVDYWSLKTIQVFDKENLYSRVCQDVFLCLKKLSESKDLDSGYEIPLNYYLKFKKKELENRETRLKENNYFPDFNKKVL